MQNFPKVSAVILVVGLVASVYLSRTMRKERVDVHKIEAPGREEMVYVPVFGIDKFWADISWMQCINSLGRVKGKMTKRNVEFFYGEFDRITDLDPDFSLVYEVGASSLAYHDLESAIKLINKADGLPTNLPADSDLKTLVKAGTTTPKAHGRKWKRPYYVAHWLLQIRARKAKEASQAAATPEEKQQHLEAVAKARKEAIGYLEMAVDQNPPWYVENMLLHTKAKLEGAYGDDYKELEAWYKYYGERVKDYEAESGAEGEGGMSGGGDHEFSESEAMARLRKRIVSRCRQLMKSILEAQTPIQDAQKQQETIRRIFAKLNTDPNYSEDSLAPYGAGDLYDAVTGRPVVPYGVDLYDLEVNGRVSSIKGGAYNTATGKKVAGTFEELKKLLKAEKKPLRRLKAHAALAKKREASAKKKGAK